MTAALNGVVSIENSIFKGMRPLCDTNPLIDSSKMLFWESPLSEICDFFKTPGKSIKSNTPKELRNLTSVRSRLAGAL